VPTRDGAELLLSLRLSRHRADQRSEEKVTVPLQVEIDGTRSVIPAELLGPQVEIRDYRIPLAAERKRGFGRISIPADANAADNECFFVFGEEPPQRTIIVADDDEAAAPLKLAAEISPDEAIASQAELMTADQLSAVEWNNVSLVLWQARLPGGELSESLNAFINRGGQVVFFPPREADRTEFLGQRWDTWTDQPAVVENWRGDEDLLARTQSGAALPLGLLEIHRHCVLAGESTHLATLRGGQPLLARATSDRGGAYFWATTPAVRDSTLATNGVVLYAFIQRALAAGALAQGQAQSLDAAGGMDKAGAWQRLLGGADGLPNEAAAQAGVYADGDRLLAVNRPAGEDDSRLLSDPVVAELFRGLDFTRVDDRAGNARSLIEEAPSSASCWRRWCWKRRCACRS
jgi:hypothetical protein